jgi:conjugal transfer pilus assembly protein TraW
MRNFALSLMFLGLQMSAYAEDLGRVAPTYPLDQDARGVIKEILKNKESSGELDKFWRDYRDKTIAAIREPRSLGLPVDLRERSETVDLKFVLPNDFRDTAGHVIAKRGTVIKPLERTPLKWGYIFIDGEDEKQVQYAVKKTRQMPLKIILTAGSPLSLREKFKQQSWMGGKTIPFYFDQRSAVINSLRTYYGIDISSVPVLISQEGSKLRLDWGLPKNFNSKE